MRVLFVSPAGGLGGSERSLLDVLAALGDAAPGLDRSLLSFAEGDLTARARALGVSVEVLPLPASVAAQGESRGERADMPNLWATRARAALDGVRYARAFRAHVRARRPDVVHTNGMKAHLLAAVATPELRRVVHFRDFASERSVTRRLLPLLGGRSVAVANSRAVAADLARNAPSLRTRVVYNGIDVDDFRPGPSTLSLHELAGLAPPPPDTLNVGLVATYAWWKGHHRFLEAAAELLAGPRLRPLRFYVIGGPVYRTPGSEVTTAELERWIRERGLGAHIGLVPFQSDPAAAHRALDVVVHASERPEPFGRTIVEAMATGRAVVVARQGGAVELFTDGEDALGYDPSVPGALARTLASLLENDELRARLAAKARENAVLRFDRRRLGPELLAVYGELAGTRIH